MEKESAVNRKMWLFVFGLLVATSFGAWQVTAQTNQEVTTPGSRDECIKAVDKRLERCVQQTGDLTKCVAWAKQAKAEC